MRLTLQAVRSIFPLCLWRVACRSQPDDSIWCAYPGANPAIVVGNAQPTLVAWLLQQPQNGRVVLTDAHIARGILEGLARHGLY